VLFECLAGEPPFGGATPSERMARVLEREPDWRSLPSSVSPNLRSLLERCLQKDRDRRVRDLRDVRIELASAFEGTTRRDASLAVLPFAHPPGAEDEYLADGITEEILNSLAQVAGLRVAARTSSFAFKGKSEDLKTIAAALDVSNVLEGSVRRAGNRLRITARLVQTSDGATLWSERYDRELTDVFELQDEIARIIAEKLAVSFGGAARKAEAAGVRNVEAYERFLRGRACVYRRGRFVYDAIADFERAVELEPDYAEALAWLSDAYRNLATFGMEAPESVMPRARAAAERALAIDPGQFEALATLADIEAQYDRDYTRALGTWERSFALERGHVRARCERALWGIGFGGISEEEAFAEVRDSVERDPLNAWAIGMWSMLQDITGDVEGSLKMARRAVEADPNSYFAQWSLLRSLAWGADPEVAVAMGREHFRATGRLVWSFAPMAVAYVRAGRTDAAVALSDELEARARSEHVSHVWRAFTAAQAGLEDRALEQLRKGAEARDPFMLQVRTFRFVEPLWGRPEFEKIAAQLGFLGPPQLASRRT
jgi:serine/threonine-protein kinase